MSNRKLILAMLACLLVLVCTACGGGKDADSGTEAIEEPDTEISEEAEVPEEEPEEEESDEEEPEENDESIVNTSSSAIIAINMAPRFFSTLVRMD